jgi:uncharacterized YccA/Bax inhibitor family protein
MRTKNPALNSDVFEKERGYGISDPMTIQGAVNKTFMLLLFLAIPAGWVWGQVSRMISSVPSGAVGQGNTFPLGMIMTVGIFGGLIVGLITAFKRSWAPVSAPIYAVLEGLFLGGISAILERSYPGIVIQSVALTLGTLFCLLMAYQSRLIKPTENFKLGLVAATGAIFLVYLVNMIMGFFHWSIPMIQSSSPMGIIFSLVVVVIAALNLVLDFDFIEQAARAGAPKYMEWYAAFGLMVTLVWLYIEILRLLAKLGNRK